LVFFANTAYTVDNPVQWAFQASSPINKKFRCLLLLSYQSDINIITEWLVEAMECHFTIMTLLILKYYHQFLNPTFFAEHVEDCHDICRYIPLSFNYFTLMIFCKCEENAIVWVQNQLREEQAVDAALVAIPALMFVVLLSILMEFPSVQKDQVFRKKFRDFEPPESAKYGAYLDCARWLAQETDDCCATLQ
jgi:hypothetical protein